MVINSKAFIIAMVDVSMLNFKYCIIVLFSFRYSNVFLEIDESRRRYLVFLCVCFL